MSKKCGGKKRHSTTSNILQQNICKVIKIEVYYHNNIKKPATTIWNL